MSEYLHREDAPFSEGVWQKIDQVVTEAAKSQLSARRLIHIEGPYGLGLSALPGADEVVAEGGEGAPELLVSPARQVALVRKGFRLGARGIAAFEQRGLPLDLGSAAAAAIACARQEDDLLHNGSKAVGAQGLLNAKGVQTSKLKPWDKVGAAADDVIAAVTRLDEAGFHGPYALGLAPDRYNLLFRRYNQGNQTEMEHLRALVTDGIVKAPAIGSGGVLLATGRQYATIVVGQDLVTAFVGPAGGDYEFVLAESIMLRLLQPAAVCVLK